MKAGLNRNQWALLDKMGAYIDQHGFSPSYDEMKDALGLAAKSNINRLVLCLEERGYIARIPNRSRSIVLTEQAHSALAKYRSATIRSVARETSAAGTDSIRTEVPAAAALASGNATAVLNPLGNETG